MLFKIDLDSYLSNMKLSENKKKDSREDDASYFFIIWFEINKVLILKLNLVPWWWKWDKGNGELVQNPRRIRFWGFLF